MIAVPILVAALLVLGSATVAFAAPSPFVPGQPGAPNVGCGAGIAADQPNGFLTDGFALAATRYAGSDGTPSLLHAQSSHAIAQYDVACFEQTSNH